MARIHAHRKGKSGSTRPYLKANPAWVGMEKAEIEETIARLHQDGLSTASIAVRLKEAYAAPHSRLSTARSAAPSQSPECTNFSSPEDLASLTKSTTRLQTDR